MSVHFRQRTPGEYLKIVWKRKWLIILPAIAISASVAWVVRRLPNVYESSTLIVVKPSNIPQAVVPAMSEDMLTRQLAAISQVVTSRSSLQPLIEKYRIYEEERAHGETMEDIVEYVHKDIRVELNTTRNDVTNGFNIKFRGRDARITQLVTAELASKYIDAQTENSSRSGQATKEFFETKRTQLKEELDDIAQRRLNFMKENLPNLPSGTETLGVQLTGLYENQKSLIADIGRMRDQQNTLSQRLGDLQKQRQQEIDNIIDEGNDPKKSTDYIQLTQREDALEAEKRNMLATLRPANPDVIKKQEEIDAVRGKMKAALDDGRARADEKRRRYEAQIDPRLNEVKYNSEYLKGEIVRQQKMLDDTNSQIGAIQGRINATPAVQVGLDTLDREYQTKQEAYNKLSEEQQKINTISDITSSQQGQSIQVVDAANLPENPVAPKRMMLMLLGIFAGLGAGLALAALFEVPRLMTVQNTTDAEHYTGLPVLIALPELLTPDEARRIPRRRLQYLAAAVVVTIISIPALAFVLTKSHFFDRFV